MVAISEARSTESSNAEDKSTTDMQENKDGIEMAVYKLSEKETVAFGKVTLYSFAVNCV